ncbi:MAG: LytTR family DNA-binding domain-containing protein [Bacteroidales bacterium]|nr:LytTR family DNA-binding domain-containing protein [Bacteroidales bacterium]
MKILIIEDEAPAAERMIQLLNEIEPEAEIFGPIDTVASSIEHLKTDRGYDLIFLDIQLADGKSFAIFDHIKSATPIIFTTAYDEYALKAFELNSVDYLLKPIRREKLSAALHKFRNLKNYFGTTPYFDHFHKFLNDLKTTMPPSYKNRFLVNRNDSMLHINTDEIACIYAEEKAVFILTRDNHRHIIPQTLEVLEEKLDPHKFFRVNRRFITSIDAIRKVHNYFNFKLKVEIFPDPDMEIIVSRSRAAGFKAWMSGE